VAGVPVVWYLCELHLDREDSAVALDDEVDLMVTAAGAQMADLRFGGLGVGSDGLGHERFEERRGVFHEIAGLDPGRAYPEQRRLAQVESGLAVPLL
jgi:hypothetical protein